MGYTYNPFTDDLDYFLKESEIDHGLLAGLGDDDHTQYLLADGSRDLTGDWTIATNAITLTAGTLTAGNIYARNTAAQTELRAYNTGNTKYISLKHDGSTAIIDSSSGSVIIADQLRPNTGDLHTLGTLNAEWKAGYFGTNGIYLGAAQEAQLTDSALNATSSFTIDLLNASNTTLSVVNTGDGAPIVDFPTLQNCTAWNNTAGITIDMAINAATATFALTNSFVDGLAAITADIGTFTDVNVNDDLTVSTKGMTLPGTGQYGVNILGALTTGIYFNTAQIELHGSATAYHWWQVGGANVGDFEMGNGTNKVTFDASLNLMDVTGGVRAAQFYADADSVGIASTNSLTKTSDLTANSSGVGTILFKGTTSRNSSGFIKFFVGTTAYFCPVFSAITG